jgi:hypothetical protein
MRSAGNLHPQWGYLAPAPRLMRTVRIGLVATVIGAIGGAAVIISLIDSLALNEVSASIATRALVTSGPVFAGPPLPQADPQPGHAPDELMAPAAASTTGSIIEARKPNRRPAQEGSTSKHRVAASNARRRWHARRRLFDEYRIRGYRRSGSMPNDW